MTYFYDLLCHIILYLAHFCILRIAALFSLFALLEKTEEPH